MKSAILYPYGNLRTTGCCRMLHAKHLALTSAVYTLNISILVVLLYAWRIGVNIKKYGDLEDVYYGVQIAYFAIIGTQLSMIVLSIILLFGIYRENSGLVVPWIIGFITFMALEAVAMVYSNVLRDHVNRQFDALCKAEVAFFISRAFINIFTFYECVTVFQSNTTPCKFRTRHYRVLPRVMRRNGRLIGAALMCKFYFLLLLGLVMMNPTLMKPWLIVQGSILILEVLFWLVDILLGEEIVYLGQVLTYLYVWYSWMFTWCIKYTLEEAICSGLPIEKYSLI